MELGDRGRYESKLWIPDLFLPGTSCYYMWVSRMDARSGKPNLVQYVESPPKKI